MHALVGNLPVPSLEVRDERTPAREATPGDRVALHIADAALILALGARPIGSAGPGLEAPIPGKGVQPAIEADFPGRGVMVLDQGAGIVEQDFRRHAPEPEEARLHPLEPVQLALAKRGTDVHPTRISERRDEQMHPDPLLGDPDPSLAEVDLQLLAGPGLEAHRRAPLGLQLPPPALDPLLHRAQADLDPVLALQLLANDVGVPAVAEEPLAQPVLQTVERRLALGLAEGRRAPGAKIAPDRVACAAELLRQPFGSPAKLVEPHHRGHLLRLDHLFSLHAFPSCRNL